MVEKLVEEEVDADTEWPEGEVADVLGKVEGCKGD
jgi:hypothetical protein